MRNQLCCDIVLEFEGDERRSGALERPDDY